MPATTELGLGLAGQARDHLGTLCVAIKGRRVGSPGNRAATDYFSHVASSYGWSVHQPAFECIDWREAGAELHVGGISFDVLVSPYTLGQQATAPLAVVSILAELEAVEVEGGVLLIRGDLAKEQLMPKAFPFFNPDTHKTIIQLLESKNPRAIIAATSRNPELAGAVYPFPLIEDGDFNIPSVYMTESDGLKLAGLAGKMATLEIRAERSPAIGCNVIARKGSNLERRCVLMAHIDAKDGTPGAIDNATGVVVLLLLAQLLETYQGNLVIELVAMNGEDYYSAPGEKRYLGDNAGRFPGIVLGINLDGVGYHEGRTAYSIYDCPPAMARRIHHTLAQSEGLIHGEPWYQSDHGLFLMHSRPALAFTSEEFTRLWAEIAHTPLDTPDIVDTGKLVQVACALRNLLLDLDRNGPK